MGSKSDIKTVFDALGLAPFSGEYWSLALNNMATLTGGWGAQFVGLSSKSIAFHLSGGIPAEIIEDFERCGGADPKINPRISACVGHNRVIGDHDFISTNTRNKLPFYVEFLERIDAPYVGIQMIESLGFTSLMCAVIRSKRQGEISPEQKKLFSMITDRMKASASLQIRMEQRSGEIAMDILDRLSKPAILCNHVGSIIAASPLAVRLLNAKHIVSCKSGRLIAADDRSNHQLQAALALATGGGALRTPKASEILLASTQDGKLTNATIAPLSNDALSLGLGGRVIVFFDLRDRPINQSIIDRFHLTNSEYEITSMLARALSPSEIASVRETSILTVRSQVKTIYNKMGVSSVAELIECVGRV